MIKIIDLFIHNHNIAVSAGILLLAYIFIAIEKIPKVTVGLLGAALTLFLGISSPNKKINGVLNANYFINFIDFDVVFLLVSMMIIVHITARSGVFNWLANQLLKLTKGKPILILISLGLFTAVTSAFLDNVTTVILLMPITFIITKELNIDPVPFLITEILTSNIGGTATLIGDPPNIIIGSAAGLSFLDFLSELSGIIALILLVNIGILVLIFRKNFQAARIRNLHLSKIDNISTITDFPLMIRSLLVLGLVMLCFISHDITHIKSYIIAMAGAGFLLIFEKPRQILQDLEWNTVFFFIGLFIIIGGLEASGGIALIAKWLLNITSGSQSTTAMLILWASGILSGIIDNIPYTVTMAPMLSQIQLVMGSEYTKPLWWCLSLGACLGGNMTLIGAAANVIVSETAARHGHPISFLRFMKYGCLVTLVSLALSSAYIYLKFL